MVNVRGRHPARGRHAVGQALVPRLADGRVCCAGDDRGVVGTVDVDSDLDVRAVVVAHHLTVEHQGEFLADLFAVGQTLHRAGRAVLAVIQGISILARDRIDDQIAVLAVHMDSAVVVGGAALDLPAVRALDAEDAVRSVLSVIPLGLKPAFKGRRFHIIIGVAYIPPVFRHGTVQSAVFGVEHQAEAGIFAAALIGISRVNGDRDHVAVIGHRAVRVHHHDVGPVGQTFAVLQGLQGFIQRGAFIIQRIPVVGDDGTVLRRFISQGDGAVGGLELGDGLTVLAHQHIAQLTGVVVHVADGPAGQRAGEDHAGIFQVGRVVVFEDILLHLADEGRFIIFVHGQNRLVVGALNLDGDFLFDCLAAFDHRLNFEGFVLGFVIVHGLNESRAVFAQGIGVAAVGLDRERAQRLAVGVLRESDLSRIAPGHLALILHVHDMVEAEPTLDGRVLVGMVDIRSGVFSDNRISADGNDRLVRRTDDVDVQRP